MNSMNRQKDMTLKNDYLGEVLIIAFISLVIIHLFRHFIFDPLYTKVKCAWNFDTVLSQYSCIFRSVLTVIKGKLFVLPF